MRVVCFPQTALFYVSVGAPCLVGLLFALALSSASCLNISRPERVSVAIECCYQNTGVATVVALNMFEVVAHTSTHARQHMFEVQHRHTHANTSCSRYNTDTRTPTHV